jgi:hypothetical protein
VKNGKIHQERLSRIVKDDDEETLLYMRKGTAITVVIPELSWKERKRLEIIGGKIPPKDLFLAEAMPGQIEQEDLDVVKRWFDFGLLVLNHKDLFRVGEIAVFLIP